MDALPAALVSLALALSRPPSGAASRPAAQEHGVAPAAAESLLREIAQSGAARVRDQLYADEARWQGVLNGVATGQPAWLEVAERLKPPSGAVAEELTRSVA